LYYIAAIHGCHPNYATYLGEKSLSNEEIERIMGLIPQEKRTVFDKDFIKTLA
jgi:4-hydroxy 2-oxovalerate aldolase